MPASNFLAKKIVELLKGVTINPAEKYFITFCEEAVTKGMTGSTLAGELTYEGFTRTELSKTEVEIIEGGGEAADEALNKLAINLKLNTNTTGKSLAKWFAIVDAAAAGNMWFYGKLATELNITKALVKVEIEPKTLKVAAE